MAAKRPAQKLDDDPLDRALSYREVGLERRPLAELGFCEANRGQLGLSSTHVHEVAFSCFSGVKLYRYKQVDVVRVPEHGLKAWRAANEQRCLADALMPKFSPSMKLACATKTHFVHANKLRAEGGRTLMNDAKTPIISKTDEEGSEDRKILEEGVLCSIYSAKLWDDPEALEALMGADNDDADVEMGEDEIQAFGRVEIAVKLCQTDGVDLTTENVLKAMQRAGLRSFTLEQTRALVDFRLTLSESVAKAFRQLVFASVSGRVTVQAADYKTVSILDVRAMWVKVGLLIHSYVTTFNAKWPPGTTALQLQRAQVSAPRFPAGCMKELAAEGGTLLKLDKLAAKLVRHYVIENPAVDKVMLARRDLFASIGKLAQKLGVALERETLKAAAQLKESTPKERQGVTDLVLNGQFAEIEHKYRSALQGTGAFTEETLPPALHPRETKGTKGTEEKAEAPVAPNLADFGRAADGSILITKEWVLHRLRLETLPGAVRVSSLEFLATSSAPASTPPGPVDASSSAQADAGKGDVFKAMLEAVDEGSKRYYPSGLKGKINYGDGTYWVDSDMLQPVEKAAAPPAPEVEVVAPVPSFEWDNMVPVTTRRVACFALDEAFMIAFETTKGLQIEKIGEKDCPCILRVRATRSFNIGECILVPFSLQEWEGWLTHSKDLGTMKKYEKADASLMDKNSISRCYIKVFNKEPKKRQKNVETARAALSETYWVHSPLFSLKKSAERAPQDLAPLWAVQRTAMSRDVNMKFETLVFEVNNILPVGKKLPGQTKHSALWSVALQALTNTKKIAANDYLNVSVMCVSDSEDDE